ncbi:MAG TPA: Mur ligase family protein [Ktedonobacterales bacterium]|jgi:UDP-N-acetylmuramyl tripeptide synthase|nr:Mur ligase family protein [Ktedonobacterales bacterium]
MSQQPETTSEKDSIVNPQPSLGSTSSARHRLSSAGSVKARRPRFSVRASAAIATGRATGTTLRRLRLGGGTSLPGLVARYIDPDLTRYLGKQLRHGSFVVTGTNGKTTTSGLVAYVLRGAGMRVWRNREGSNLARGVATALITRSRLSGRLREGGDAAFVFEVDEAAFPRVVADLRPRAITITNLFRDQLDRYGEVDSVAEHWRSALRKLPEQTTLVLNADDPAVAALADTRPAGSPILYYGVNEAPPAEEGVGRVEVIDTRTCPRCGHPLEYSLRFYSHVGHWACPACGFARPTPQVCASEISFDGLEGSRFTLSVRQGAAQVHVGLPGLYNVYNALAAAAAGILAGAQLEGIQAALARFTPAFGRAERIEVDGRTAHLLLAKNPTGLNEVMRALAREGHRHHMLLILNDRAADGEDVSWIWDADFEQVAGLAASLTVSGTRAYDLSVRMKYAGVPADAVEPDIAAALSRALERVPQGETLYIVPTYTAMLAVRGELERRGYVPHYWEQEDES